MNITETTEETFECEGCGRDFVSDEGQHWDMEGIFECFDCIDVRTTDAMYGRY